MPRAVWNGAVLAESHTCIELEGNFYFPPESVRMEYLKKSKTTTVCPWKGNASYYTIEVDRQCLEDGAWCYPEPKEAAKHLKNHFVFWKGVQVDA